MARNRTILDCYTDEPAGLGVPPYLGVWPRYVAGQYSEDLPYLTIDDLRLVGLKGKLKEHTLDPPTGRTRIEMINHTRSPEEIHDILRKTKQLIIIAGVHTPGKYLSGQPGTLAEVRKLLGLYKCRKILTGPVVVGGTQFRGGNAAEIPDAHHYDDIRDVTPEDYQDYQAIALNGAKVLKQIPQPRIVEIETGRGCSRIKGCSFCTEPLKNRLQWRSSEHVIDEVKAFMDLGATAFRLGKQSCIYSHPDLESLLPGLSALGPQVMHIDNANPAQVTEAKTELLVQHLTPGSTAAMGVESFDPAVQEANNLNCRNDMLFDAIGLINRIGGHRSDNGCHHLLPGINILLGLKGETEETLERNFAALQRLLDEGLLVRRINIRKVVPFPGTRLHDEVGHQVLQKNQKLYPQWIEKVRHEIDQPLLQRLFPLGTVLKDLICETHEGNVSFLRQLGSYPIIVGVKQRLPLGSHHDVRVTDHMLRSLTGEVIT